MLLLLAILTLFLLYLVSERVALTKLRRSVPLVIAVTGTRGKSGVVRMLGSIIRESGRTVIAKTTGSEAQIILPDGSVEDIPRRGIPSILEQKKILFLAARRNADCLVAEIMSIQPDYHRIESQEILRPNVVLVTNVRRDHLDAMGTSEESAALALRNTVPADAPVFIPERYQHFFEKDGPASREIRVRGIAAGSAAELTDRLGRKGELEFAENLELVQAVARDLGIDDGTIIRGIERATHDRGKLGVWEYRTGARRIFLVNAFAANEPESTREILAKIRQILGRESSAFTGLLNLRYDRGDRTMQWIDAMNGGMMSEFDRLHVVGGHSRAFCRKVRGAHLVSGRSPAEITQSIASVMPQDGVLVGMGNIRGMAERILEHWRKEGSAYGV